MSEIAKKSVEQKDAEAEVESFRKDLGPFVVAAETTRMAMLFADAAKPEHPMIFANDSFLSLTAYDREEVLGKSFNFLMAHRLLGRCLHQPGYHTSILIPTRFSDGRPANRCEVMTF